MSIATSVGVCRQQGFTLIELIATLTILAILASLAFPVAEVSARRMKEQELRLHLRTLRDGIDAYHKAWEEGRITQKAGSTGYPPNLERLVEGEDDLRAPQKSKIYFLRSIPTDPFAAPGLTGSASWGKRAYASSHDEPKEGEDVFDIYSRSEETGLNGIPYRQW